MSVDQTLAAVLKSDASYVGRETLSFAAWSARGVEVKAIGPFATQAAAEEEAARAAAFLGGPTVRDQVIVPGQRRDLVGSAIRVRLASGDLGYGVPMPVFVIAAEERDVDTALSVLRRL